MKQHQFSFVQALIVAVGVLFFSSCNGEKIDSDLIDSITGKVSVEKITIDQEDFEMTEGESTVLTATVLPADATDKTVSWHSSKEEVVMISNTGKAMAIAPGKSIITAKAGSKTDFITITVIANAVPVTGISLDKTTLELKVGDSETLTATVTPPDATNKNVIWSSDNTSVVSVDQSGKVTAKSKGTATIKATANDGSGISGSCSVAVIQTSGAVDLGLSVKWAACNLCESGFVSSPEDYGDYYAWGETQPYYTEGHSQDNPCSDWRSRTNPVITGYNWSSYKWCNGSSSTLTKYNTSSRYGSTVDKKNVLEDDDDVAHVKLGGSWRMPTDAEWTELRNTNNCTWTWTTQNGINGYKVTSKKNGASIFLPAAGRRGGTSLNHVGSDCHYWSSSLYTDSPPFAHFVEFSPVGFGGSGGRYDGFSVRPVSE